MWSLWQQNVSKLADRVDDRVEGETDLHVPGHRSEVWQELHQVYGTTDTLA
jgi:hypothetical protein